MKIPFGRFQLNLSISKSADTVAELPALIEASDQEVQRMQAQHRLNLDGNTWPADSVRYRNARPRVS
jgi:hypothetical protein